MERQKFPPPVSTKITRKLASQSTEHNSLLNFYSSISTDETGAPKRWKMSSNVQIDEDFISSGKTSPVPNKSTSRDNSTDRKGRPGPKKGWKDKESTDNGSSRDSSLEGKEKNKGSIELKRTDLKRDSSTESSKGRKTDEEVSRSRSLDKAKFYGSASKINGNPQPKKKGRPKSLDLISKLSNGDDESFKSPDPLTPCNVAVKRKKGRPKETPPTLVAETSVGVPESPAETQASINTDTQQPSFESGEMDADVEDNIEIVVKKKRVGRPKLKAKKSLHVIDNATNETAGEISKRKQKNLNKVLGQKKGLKGQRVLSKLKGKANLKRPKHSGYSNILDVKVQPSNDNVVKKKKGRPPGAKNKATILKEQLMAKLLESKLSQEQKKEHDNTMAQTQLLDTLVCDNNVSTTQTTSSNDYVEKVSDLNASKSHINPTEIKDINVPSLKDEVFTEDISAEYLKECESVNVTGSNGKTSHKTKFKKTLGVKKGAIKSRGKLKKEEDGNKKVRKKRILSSYASNGGIGSSLDHLPKNDLRRYLQMKLIERLNGNRSLNSSLLKPFPEKEEKSEKEDVYSEDDSMSVSDPVKDTDIQSLSALVEQKRIRSESDASEQRRSASRSRKSSVDLSKISDNESISSELSVNSISSAKRIFVLGEDNADTDDSIRTRQRVEIVPGKSRKRTLSGEFDLVDETQLRKEKKLARISGSGIELSGKKDEIGINAQVTPFSSPMKIKKKSSPKLVAIKQKLDAQRDQSLPFVSQLRKRLLKQSPFLTRMRRKKKRKPENRGLSPNKKKDTFSNDILPIASSVLQEMEEKSDIKTSQENINSLDELSLHNEMNEETNASDIVVLVKDNVELEENKANINRDQSVDIQADITVISYDKVEVNDKVDVEPFVIENEVHEIIMTLITKVVALNEPVFKEEISSDKLETEKATYMSLKETSVLSVPTVEIGIFKKKKGRPKKVRKIKGRKRILPIKPVDGTPNLIPVKTGAKRGRKPKSAKVIETSELSSVRTFQLRQKISRSPLDNIALKQSIEESEYIKNEVQRANKKEAKLLKSKRSQASPIEQFSVIPLEPAASSFIDCSLTETTETATESDLSEDECDTSYEAKTIEDYIKECKPCSVVVTDFFKQLQKAQKHTFDDESATETEDFGEDFIEDSENQTPIDTQNNSEKKEDSEKKNPEVSEDSVKNNGENQTEKELLDWKIVQAKSEETPSKKELKRQSTFSSSQVVQELQSVTPKSEKTKSPQNKKKSPTKTIKSNLENQTARKTVPPLKIKLKGGIRKTYMVESTLAGQDIDKSPAPVHKPVKKKKNKSSSKSGSDSDRGNKGHHHHHHKKRNKSPLVGQVGVFPEKKSKPTAIVAASPSIKPNPIPKDPYEATFLEFIQNKEKDFIHAPTPTPGKVRPLYDMSKFKDMAGNVTVAASPQSIPIASVASFTENQNQASLYNSISKNTSLVNSFINDNLKKTVPVDNSNAPIENQKKSGPLFIGVMGTKSNVHYFCSHCVNEVHKTDDLVLKHFAAIHPGAPIMYRRVADSKPNEQLEPSNNFDCMNQPVPDDSSKKADASGDMPVVENTNIGNQEPMQNQQSSTTHQTNQVDTDKQSPSKRDNSDDSDTGSLNLKIVEVVSLKDQISAIDVEEPVQEKESTISVEETPVNNRVLSPELKIPQFPRSTSSSAPQQGQQRLLTKTLHQGEQILQTYPSTKPLQRKTPGLITPGKFCNTFKCEKCNVHAPVLGAMVAHLRNAHTDIPRLFQCPYCRDIEAETEALIHQHIRKKHPTDNLNPPVALSEKAKSNLRTLSVRVPDSKANDTSFLEKDIYMCLNCKVHMPSLEAIYDHLERVHTEVFVFVCSACKVFKSKTEKDVLLHYQTDPLCRTKEKNISLAIDGSQFTRVPCLMKEKTKNKSVPQPKAPQQPSPVPSVKQPPPQSNTNTQANSIVQALQKQSLTPAQILQHGLNMQQFFQQQFGPMISPAAIPHHPKGSVTQQPTMVAGPVVLSQPPSVMSQPVLVSPPAVVPQSTLASHPAIPPSFIIQPSPLPSQVPLISPNNVTRTLPSASHQPVFPHSTLVVPTASTLTSSTSSALTFSSHISSISSKVSVVASPSQVSSISTFTSTSALTSCASSISTVLHSSISSASSVTTSSSNIPVSSAPTKPTGAKKRKNLLESIQHIKMQKQREQLAKMEKMETESVSDRDYLSTKSESPLGPLSSSPSPVPSESTASNPNNNAPPPLIRGPPPLIRFDQLNPVPLSAAVPMQSGGISQQAVKQVSTPLQISKSDTTKSSIPPRQIQSSLFDTSDPESFKPVQRTPVLNVPSVPRANRSPAAQLSSQKPNQLKLSTTPLDLSRTTPTNSPASSPPVHDIPLAQNKPDTSNQEVYSVFNLKPSTQAQLPKEALQNRTGIHQLPPKVPIPPQTVRPNTANTLAYRPQHPHISTTQVPQVINMPLGMLNNMGNIVVSMPSFQVVQGMPGQLIRMTGTQLITSPGNQVPVNVSVAMPTAPVTRPALTSQPSTFQSPINDTFKCPYCPKVVPLTFAQVKPHIEAHHPGCSVMLKRIESQ